MTHAEIIAAIENMTILELADLVKAMEEKFGISAAAPLPLVLAPVLLLPLKLLKRRPSSTSC